MPVRRVYRRFECGDLFLVRNATPASEQGGSVDKRARRRDFESRSANQ
jgi:hypothetical protein